MTLGEAVETLANAAGRLAAVTTVHTFWAPTRSLQPGTAEIAPTEVARSDKPGAQDVTFQITIYLPAPTSGSSSVWESVSRLCGTGDGSILQELGSLPGYQMEEDAIAIRYLESASQSTVVYTVLEIMLIASVRGG